MTALLAAIVLLTALLWFTRAPRKRGGVTPQTQAQRVYDWHQRLDAAIGNESEERLMLHAKGAIAKRRMLAYLRNREERKNQPAGVPVVRRKLKLAR